MFEFSNILDWISDNFSLSKKSSFLAESTFPLLLLSKVLFVSITENRVNQIMS